MKRILYALGASLLLFLFSGWTIEKSKINFKQEKEALAIAWCSINYLPSTGVKTESSKCYCDMPKKDELHGFKTNCDKSNFDYCQAEGCAIGGCCQSREK